MSRLPPEKEALAWRMAAIYCRFFNAWAGQGPLPELDPADYLRADPAYDDEIERRLYELLPVSEVLWRVKRVRGIKAWADSVRGPGRVESPVRGQRAYQSLMSGGRVSPTARKEGALQRRGGLRPTQTLRRAHRGSNAPKVLPVAPRSRA